MARRRRRSGARPRNAIATALGANRDADVVVIGAGASGLAAAGRLLEAGREPLVLEARERMGGRILTTHAAGLAVPIELGAEFIHGEAKPIRTLAARHGWRAMDVGGRRYQKTRNGIVPADAFWRRIDRVLRRLETDRGGDRSLAEALAAHRRTLAARDRSATARYIESYDAADAAAISARSLADAGAPSDDPRETRAGRLVDGYAPLVDALAGPLRSRIRLGCVVFAVRWRRSHVEVHCRDAAGVPLDPFRARAAIVTVPIGVLHAPPGSAGAIAFEPPIPSIARAAASIAMGPVVKLLLHFDAPFWVEPSLAKRLDAPDIDEMTFIQSSSSLPFSVWWTPYPVRAPLLVAWSGGPAAAALARCTRADLVARSVASLAAIFDMRPAALRRRLVGVHHHDWLSDPFARGAYSYALVGGHRAGRDLSRAVQRTLWFAGEATAPDGATGTVHGAIASGWHAADDLLSR